jgi:hypothetical protein
VNERKTYVFLDCHKPHAEDQTVESDYAIEDSVVRDFIQKSQELARWEWFWPDVVPKQRSGSRKPSMVIECGWLVALES